MGTVNDLALYRVDVRVNRGAWDILRAVGRMNLPGLEVNRDPPRALDSPEVEVSFLAGGLTAVAAERRARERLENHGMYVFAIRARVVA